jgi:L-histidine N-alpha-methyltransferase
VTGVVGDFVGDLGLIPDGDRRLFAFLGGTIGNLVPDERTEFLGELRELMDGDDRLLVGMDLVKDPAVIEAAYDDAEGITAEFNRNALRVVNHRLDGDFLPDRFEHVAFFDSECSWIEMRLRSVGRQSVRLRGADLELELEDGEEIRTEISAKFTPEAIEGELAAAGLRLDELLTDRDGLFGLARATRD